jgi:tetratricopeptide (TPR) repeat protein
MSQEILIGGESMAQRYQSVLQLLRALEDERSPGARALRPECDYQGAVASAVAKALAVAGRLDGERQGATADLEGLLALPRGERAAALAAADGRCRSPLLFELLLRRSRDALRRDPEEARELAVLAERVAGRVPPAFGAAIPARLAIRAVAHRANALRVAGEVRRADALWTEIHARAAGEPGGDPTDEAELASLEASLRADQRRFDEAARLLRRAIHRYRVTGDAEGLARARLQHGRILLLRGRPAEAAGVLRESARGLEPEADGDLLLMTRHNLALALCELGDFAGADEVVGVSRALYRQAERPWAGVRLAWIEGRIARGLGRPEEAERRFDTARRGFLEQGNGFNAALVALDLAELRLAQGDTAGVRRLAEGLAPVLAAHDLHREAVQALLLFQRAAAAERVSAELLARLRAYLALARRDPRLRFREPG